MPRRPRSGCRRSFADNRCGTRFVSRSPAHCPAFCPGCLPPPWEPEADWRPVAEPRWSQRPASLLRRPGRTRPPQPELIPLWARPGLRRHAPLPGSPMRTRHVLLQALQRRLAARRDAGAMGLVVRAALRSDRAALGVGRGLRKRRRRRSEQDCRHRCPARRRTPQRVDHLNKSLLLTLEPPLHLK